MYERVIYNILTAGIEYFTSNPTRLALFFRYQRGLSADEAEKLKELFIAKPPRVQHGYPTAESTFPTFCILLESEQTTQNFLGNAGMTYGSIEDVQTEFGFRQTAVPAYAAIVQGVYKLVIAAENNPDVCIFLYELVKFIITRARNTWLEEGVGTMDWSGGDLAPNTEYEPHYIFERHLTLTIQAVYETPMPAMDGIVSSVEGIRADAVHIAGVAANVDPTP